MKSTLVGLPSRGFLILSLLILSTTPISAQAQGRIWGRISTVSGEIHEGFIRWDRNEGSWVDLLNGSKVQRPVEFREWSDIAHPDDPHRDRVIEVPGYRITWDDSYLDWPNTADSGIRFGNIRRLEVVDDQAHLELRSGFEVELEGGATDLGYDLRDILVEKSDGSVVSLEWEDLDWMELGAATANVQPKGDRLHGTVEDSNGVEYTGYISWGPSLILTSDTLTGEGYVRGRGIRFGDIAHLEKIVGGARLTLTNGEEKRLIGSGTVDYGRDGVLISDPDLGSVEVDWAEFESVDFHPPELPVTYGSFDDVHRLWGTVETEDGMELTGWILWDGDEEFSWELLDGFRDGVTFDVEFGKIAEIERSVQVTVGLTIGSSGAEAGRSRRDGALVTLLDGRVLELDGSNDVDSDNKGIFVLVSGSGDPENEETEWVRVRWQDFHAVRFEH